MEIIKPNWDIFKAKYSENPQENFEWFCYLLFCREYNKPNGILRYKNQSGIETNPVELDSEIIGWQSKFYEGKLSTHKEDLIGTLVKSKRDYPHITKIIFYTNSEWTQVHKKKDAQAEKSQAQIDSEKKAEDLKIEIEWRTASYFESEFVSMTSQDISKHFFIYESKNWRDGINVSGNLKGIASNKGTAYQTIVDGNNNKITIIHESSKDTKTKFTDGETLQKKLEKYLENKDELELVKKTTLKYLPERYSEPIPETIVEIISFLIAYGKSDKTLPIKCVLNELNQYYGFPIEIKNYIEYLDEVKYTDINYACIENSRLSKVYILIEFLYKDNANYMVNMWEYYNKKFVQDSLFEPPTVDLESKISIKSFFDYLIDFLDNVKYQDIDLYLEIILPFDELSKGIKEWEYSGKHTSKRLISKYKYVLRIQDRFRNSSILKWESKWEKLAKEKELRLLSSNHLVSSIYKEELSDEDMVVITYQKIENITDILYDMDEYNISIALLRLSDDMCNNKYNGLIENNINDCRTLISSHVCSNHKNSNSDLIFILDNPMLIPNDLKQPYDNLLGFN